MKDGYLIFNYCTILIEEFYVDKNLGQNLKFEVEISAKGGKNHNLVFASHATELSL